MSQDRERHYLETQAMRIQQVLTRHGIPGQVEGGAVQGRRAWFDLPAHLSAGWERVQTLSAELKTALGAPDVQISRYAGRWRIQVGEPTGPAVDLLDLMAGLPPLPPATTTLGLAQDGTPIVLNFVEDDIGHVLIAGRGEAGKTALLRSMALSAALTSRQAQLQLVALSPGERQSAEELRLLSYIPHMMLPLVRSRAAAHDALSFLSDEMAYRLRHRRTRPTIIVLIDELETLLEGVALEHVAGLLQAGEQAGIHLVLSTARPDGAGLNELLRAHLAIRLVGRVQDAAEARAASGVRDSEAELLPGRGAFLAVANGAILTEFQAAYIDEHSMLVALDRLQRTPQPVLRAQPLAPQPATLPATASEMVTFGVDVADGSVRLHTQPAAFMLEGD